MKIALLVLSVNVEMESASSHRNAAAVKLPLH